jgi:hypothetical protein
MRGTEFDRIYRMDRMNYSSRNSPQTVRVWFSCHLLLSILLIL